MSASSPSGPRPVRSARGPGLHQIPPESWPGTSLSRLTSPCRDRTPPSSESLVPPNCSLSHGYEPCAGPEDPTLEEPHASFHAVSTFLVTVEQGSLALTLHQAHAFWSWAIHQGLLSAQTGQGSPGRPLLQVEEGHGPARAVSVSTSLRTGRCHARLFIVSHLSPRYLPRYRSAPVHTEKKSGLTGELAPSHGAHRGAGPVTQL